MTLHCACCGEGIGPNDTVYRTAVGEVRGTTKWTPLDRPTNTFEGWSTALPRWRIYRRIAQLPVCEGCRPDGDNFRWSDPTPCGYCGRPLRSAFTRLGKGARTCAYACAIGFQRQEAKRIRQEQRTAKTCSVCCREFVPSRNDATTCSHKCRQKAYRDRQSVTDDQDENNGKDSNLITCHVTDGRRVQQSE